MTTSGKPMRAAGINPPTDAFCDDTAYQRECTFAIDPSVDSLINMAAEAGWTRQHVIVAIIFAAARHLDDQATFDRLAGLGHTPLEMPDALH